MAFERPAKGQPVLPQHLDVLQEREGARRRDVLDEAVFGDAQRARLVPQQRVVVADAVGDLEVVRRVERDPLVAARERNRPDDLQVLARGRQLLHARFLNQVHERRGAAVHDRHFRRVQLDQHVVDAEADERRQQVLNRFDRHLVARERRGQLNARQVLDVGRDLAVPQVGPAKADAEVRGGGLQRQLHLVAGMESDPDTGNRATERTLCVHEPLKQGRAWTS
jgi:hypothetical protein